MSKIITLTGSNGNVFTFHCRTWETRQAWGHIANIFINGEDHGETKVRYYNRTWESWTYQSAVIQAVNTMIGYWELCDIQDHKDRTGRKRLTQAEKDAVTAQDARIAEARGIVDRLHRESF